VFAYFFLLSIIDEHMLNNARKLLLADSDMLREHGPRHQYMVYPRQVGRCSSKARKFRSVPKNKFNVITELFNVRYGRILLQCRQLANTFFTDEAC